MVRVKKANGRYEEFSKAKLEKSIELSGASAAVAQKVTARVKPVEGMPTAGLRQTVAKELERENAALSSAYASSRSLKALAAEDIQPGVAKIPEETMRSLELKAGQKARLSFSGKTVEVSVQKAAGMAQKGIMLSGSDLKKLGASDGAKVGLRLERT